MPAKMIVVAGPPGSGKSSIFPVSSFGVRYFNADDRAAELNGGSYIGIPRQIRAIVNREFEAFVAESIENRTSFAIETTLRATVTLNRRRGRKPPASQPRCAIWRCAISPCTWSV
jgi:predicted ABC-type ATPase